MISELLQQDYDNDTINLTSNRWREYFINVEELCWARNNHDGYLVDVYLDENHTQHLGRFIL